MKGIFFHPSLLKKKDLTEKQSKMVRFVSFNSRYEVCLHKLDILNDLSVYANDIECCYGR